MSDDKQLTTRDEVKMTATLALQDPKLIRELERAAPRDVDGARIARIVLTVLRGSDALQKCDIQSVLSAAMVCAQTGLEPGPIGHAAIIPYKGRAQWQAMYKGLLHLAYRSEQISGVSAGVYCENDTFDWEEGSGAFVKHKKFLNGDRGPAVAAYASIGVKGGEYIVRVEPWEEIRRIRDQYSKTRREQSAWQTEPYEMAAKTMIKRAMKYAPISPEAKVAIGMDDLADLGKDQPTQLTEKDITEISSDSLQEKPAGEFCNRNVGAEGAVCGREIGHEGECRS